MIERLNPETAPRPASNYVQAVRHANSGKRLVISGQVGLSASGVLAQGLEAQLRQCWANLYAVLEGAGFAREHLVKSVIYVTVPDAVGLSRKIRDEATGGLPHASTYLQVVGLASADFLCEIEGEAVME
jgi:enamine deaminase RidA (YjgF/YER057c/UK114 family)